MSLEQDKQTIENYHAYLTSRIEYLDNANLGEASEEAINMIKKAADGLRHELKYVSHHLHAVNKQLNPEVLSDDAELGVTRTVNGINQ